VPGRVAACMYEVLLSNAALTSVYRCPGILELTLFSFAYHIKPKLNTIPGDY
jgi:hypothetical protein